MRSGLFLLIILSVVGCATPRPYYAAEPNNTYRAPSSVNGCSYVTEHLADDGTVMPAGYFCALLPGSTAHGGNPTDSASRTESASASTLASTTSRLPSECSFVAGYTKKDGTTVSPHIRCKTYTAAIAYRATGSTVTPTSTVISPAPSATSSGGSVSVKGYYKKDGTYVRPHTRRK